MVGPERNSYSYSGKITHLYWTWRRGECNFGGETAGRGGGEGLALCSLDPPELACKNVWSRGASVSLYMCRYSVTRTLLCRLSIT